MSRERLQVRPVHLRELAVKHGRAAVEMASATDVVADTGTRVRTSHGVIATATADAVDAILYARRIAGDSMAQDSHALNEKLTVAATRYEATDHASGARVGAQIQPQ